MSLGRRCSRTTCNAPAVATLTYSYSDRQAVLGPLAADHEPGAYDLCSAHAARLSAPQGWDVIRLPFEPIPVGPSRDDLSALADAVRAVGLRSDDAVADPAPAPGVVSLDERRRRHTR